ncbi:carbohydrate ABC transporter permease [Aquiluna sp.]|nr:carbohydrate ABC transporter permease [Aquiluna sp.]MDA7760927.1 carbohydrate ABC transporter permease [Aquiluna sp.]MDA9010350.1 carbohydrate ABC transporter permease [Aquiluna sp.]MDB4018806.1 carbohydrate ABC transporter permease [Aquiluna sp.]
MATVQTLRAKKRAKDIFSSPFASAAAWIIAVVWTVPTFGLLVSSIRPETDINSSGWWNFFVQPNISFENYQKVLFEGTTTNPPLFQFFFNSLAVTIPAVIFPITLAVFAAYALAWFDFKGRDFLFFGIFALQVVPLQLTLIPLLQLFAKGLVIGDTTIIPDLGITGTYIPIWIAHTIFALPLAVFLLHNFISQIPKELIEAARVDGAGPFTLFTKIILPLSAPAIASFLIFQFLWVWNDLLVGLTFGAGSKEVAPMTVRIAEMVGTRGSGWEVLTAGAFVSMIVPLIVFFALQRYFVRGLLAGSVKG